MQTPPVWFPAEPSLAAYGAVTGLINAGRSFLNSAIIAGVTTAGILVTSLMAGYVFAKYRFRGRDAIFAILLATMFLPPIVTLIPLYRIISSLQLNATLIGVILPNLANAFGIFLMRQFILGIPNELIEAARLDGASELRIVFTIIAPAVASSDCSSEIWLSRRRICSISSRHSSNRPAIACQGSTRLSSTIRP